ncbi:MAG: hypothetical protein HZC41_12780 [Chloroflexi bacterium]|nr:hypothetical protein [Chloroflexota bacterium]
MRSYRSVQDTFSLLAGARVPRSARPGERLTRADARRDRPPAMRLAFITRILLSIRSLLA